MYLAKRKRFTPSNLSSLSPEQFSYLQKYLEVLQSRIPLVPYNERLDKLKKIIQCKKIFRVRGVQGLVGILDITLPSQETVTLIFKISLNIDNSIEHEHQILQATNELRNYCPHFVYGIGMVNIPIPNTIMSLYRDTEKYSSDIPLHLEDEIFLDDEETLPRNILLLEKIEDLTFYDFCRRMPEKNIISVVLQVLLALEIAQREKGFTHYDLHTSNILIQRCSENSMFLYSLKERKILVPTFGFYPVIIDMGISYARRLEGKYMSMSTENYDYGLQSCIFDRLSDVHIFLLSCFYYLQNKSPLYERIYRDLDIIFRHIDIIEDEGRKKLPNDLADKLLQFIQLDSPSYLKYDFFCDNQKEFVNILNGLIKLPLKQYPEKDFSFEKAFPVFLQEFFTLFQVDDFSGDDILFILKNIIQGVNKYRDSQHGAENFKFWIEKNLKSIFPLNINYKINFYNIFYVLQDLAEIMENNYYSFLQENIKKMEEMYELTIPQCPLDLLIYLARNFTPHSKIDGYEEVYFWDTVNKCNYFNTLNLSSDDTTKINSLPFLERGEFLYKRM